MATDANFGDVTVGIITKFKVFIRYVGYKSTKKYMVGVSSYRL